MTHFDRDMMRPDAEDHFSDRHDGEALGASEPVALCDNGQVLIIWDDIVFTGRPRWWQFRLRRRNKAVLAWWREVGRPKIGRTYEADTSYTPYRRPDPWDAAIEGGEES